MHANEPLLIAPPARRVPLRVLFVLCSRLDPPIRQRSPGRRMMLARRLLQTSMRPEASI
jgi:hypothetical protein